MVSVSKWNISFLLILVFSKGDLQSLAAILQVFQEFEALSGLSISQEKKSKLDFHRACTCQASICQRLGIESGCLPIKYLGLPSHCFLLCY